MTQSEVPGAISAHKVSRLTIFNISLQSGHYLSTLECEGVHMIETHTNDLVGATCPGHGQHRPGTAFSTLVEPGADDCGERYPSVALPVAPSSAFSTRNRWLLPGSCNHEASSSSKLATGTHRGHAHGGCINMFGAASPQSLSKLVQTTSSSEVTQVTLLRFIERLDPVYTAVACGR